MSLDSTTARDGAEPCSSCMRHGHCLGAVVQQAGPEAEAPSIAVMVLQRGQSLHRVGDPMNAVYIVQSGALKSRRHSLRGEEEIVAFRMPGDTVGLDDVGQARHGTEAVALCTTRVCRLPFEALQSNAQMSSTVAGHLFGDIGREFERLHDRLQNERHSAQARIAGFLLAQLRRRQRLFGAQIDRFTLPMTRVDLGRFLGLATETVSRMFTRLQFEGLIACDGASVQVLDVASLARRASDVEPERMPVKRAA